MNIKQKYVEGQILNKQFFGKIGSKEFVLCNETRDRHSDILKISGMEVANFEKNPQMFKNHNESIGIWENLHFEDSAYVGTPKFHLLNFASEETYHRQQGDFIRAASVGIRVLEVELVTENNVDTWILKSTELLEVSLVDIPANQTALAKSFSSDFNLESDEIKTYSENDLISLEKRVLALEQEQRSAKAKQLFQM